MAAQPHLSLSRLRNLIGRRLDYQGRPCQVVDVLEDGPQLVLRVLGENIIQADQWGDAHRRTPESFAIAVYETDSGEINPLLREFLAD